MLDDAGRGRWHAKICAALASLEHRTRGHVAAGRGDTGCGGDNSGEGEELAARGAIRLYARRGCSGGEFGSFGTHREGVEVGEPVGRVFDDQLIDQIGVGAFSFGACDDFADAVEAAGGGAAHIGQRSIGKGRCGAEQQKGGNGNRTDQVHDVLPVIRA